MKFLLGIIFGLILIPIGAYIYLVTGSAPVATNAPAFPFERRIAHMALNARIAKEAPTSPGLPADEGNLLAGAHLYREHCAFCHGLPNEPKSASAKGMYPPPPQLFHGKGVTDDTPGETYWKIKNGIRLTGMPAYGQSMTEPQMWQIAQLLATEKLPGSVTDYLNQPPPAK